MPLIASATVSVWFGAELQLTIWGTIETMGQEDQIAVIAFVALFIAVVALIIAGANHSRIEQLEKRRHD